MRVAFTFCLTVAMAGFGSAVEARPVSASHSRHLPAQVPRPQAAARDADPLTRIVATSPLFRRRAPVNSGPGVVICEPVPRNAGAETADFGNGCARWLNYAGLPEQALAVVREERERPALRAQVDRFRKTHSEEQLPPLPGGTPALMGM